MALVAPKPGRLHPDINQEVHVPAFPTRQYRRSHLHLAACVLSGGGLAFVLISACHADSAPVIFTDNPEQVIPTYAEVGIGGYTPPATGTVSSTGSGGSGGTTSGGTSTTSSDLTTMESQSWGAEAAQNATALGVDPNALAATCVIESQCQNLTGAGTVAGAFQMTSSVLSALAPGGRFFRIEACRITRSA